MGSYETGPLIFDDRNLSGPPPHNKPGTGLEMRRRTPCSDQSTNSYALPAQRVGAKVWDIDGTKTARKTPRACWRSRSVPLHRVVDAERCAFGQSANVCSIGRASIRWLCKQIPNPRPWVDRPTRQRHSTPYARSDRPVERQRMSHSLLGFRARPHPSGAQVRGMKTVSEFRLCRTIIVTGAMFVSAWGSQQVRSQNLDCNNGCGTYAEYALAQRLRLPASIQNMDRSGIAEWFSHHPQYSSRLKAVAAECESSCAKCGDWTCP